MRATLVVALFVVGCTGTQGPKGDTGPAGAAGARGEPGVKGDTGERGEQGPAGPQGVPGPVASNGRVVVWVDATGAVVGPEPVFIDDAGVRWTLDLETGQVTMPPSSITASLHFVAEDCAGPPLVEVPVPPRVAFRLSLDGGVFVRSSDTIPAVPTTVRSAAVPAGNCLSSSVGNERRVIELSNLRALAIPVPDVIGPLHPEWR